MTNMADYVILARIHGGEWGVLLSSAWGPVSTKDIGALISQIALTAHVAEGKNDQEQRERDLQILRNTR